MPRPPNIPQGNSRPARLSRTQTQQLVAQALMLHQNGQLSDAAVLYEQILRVDARNFDALHLMGIIAAQTKNYKRAVELIGKAIKINPTVATAHSNRGNAFKDLGQFEDAIASYNRAIALNPGYAEAYYNRGIALEELKQLEKAIRSYDRAIALKPDLATAYYNRANALKDLRQLDVAVESYDRAIALKPDYAEAYSNRGAALREMKQLERAIESCDRAIALNPELVTAYYNRGNALKDLREFDAAVESYDRAITLKADFAEAINNRGVAFDELNQPERAVASYDRAIELKPNWAELYCNRGNSLRNLNQMEAAIESYDRAIALKPDYATAHCNRGIALVDLKQIETAVESFERAMALQPDLAFLAGTLLHTKHQLCNWNMYSEDVQKIETSILNGEKASSTFSLLAITDFPGLQKMAAETWTKARYPSPNALGPIPRRGRSKKIRVAYVAADFHESPMGYNMVGFFEAHDREKFETYAISYGPNVQSPLRQRLVGAFDHFVDAREKTDLEIVRGMREFNIDIAVDSMGPTGNERGGIFALKCAPLQVNHYGWTSGADFMDYIIADAVALPPEYESYYSEKIVRLPHTFFATDDQRAISDSIPTRAELNLPERGFVFCAFNNSYKITPPVFDTWIRLLHKVPCSVLWMRENNPVMVRNLLIEAQKRGIDPARIVFAERAPSMADHLARHRLADLFLDNFPFCAQTTASDALWAGLPLITCMGAAMPSRVAASLLNAVGLPELITTTLDEYETKALHLASNPLELGEIRRKLEQNRLMMPLFNTKLYARHITAAYEAMYERYHAGLPPDHLRPTALVD